MKHSVTHNGISILLAAMFLALTLYPVATASAQDPGLKSAWERVQEAGSYRFLSTIDQTLVPRAIPEMIGQQEQRLRTTMNGSALLPDQAYIEMWVESGARQVSPVVLIRDGNQDFIQLDGELSPVENPFGAILPTGDWLGYLVAAKNAQIIEPAPGEADDQVRFRFEIDGPRLAEYVREQAEAALSQEPDAPAGLSVASSPLLKRLTGVGELWVGADGLPTRQVLDLSLPQVSNAYDAQLHVVVGMSDFGQVENLPRVVPGEDGSWQLQTIAPLPPSTSGGLPIVSRVSSALRVAYSDLVFFWLCLIVAAVFILYRRRPRQTYALIAVATVMILIAGPMLESAQTAAFFERHAQAAANQEDSARDLAAALGLALETDQAMEAVTSNLAGEPDPQISDGQLAAPPSSSLAGPVTTQVLAPALDSETALIDSCGEGDPDRDFDQDGLSDYDEGCYGTDPYDVDTDNDTITDTLEVQGFELNGEHCKLCNGNALNVDSNGDGLPDGVEWPMPIGEAPSWDPDEDGIPNIWDEDNDGDGVPDSTDLSPFAVGVYDPESIEVWDQDRQGYQYIEFQLQPEDHAHLRYTTTWLDWPDNDTEGQVTSPITGTRDLHLVPFLEVTTNAAPEEELRTKYGLALMQEPGKADHLLIPLFPQTTNGGVDSFYGKVVYGPSTQPQVRWTDAQLVWLVQNVDADGESGVIHRYVESFRLTGMQVTKSDVYELGLYGTPDSPQEDASLFKLLFGMSATVLEYGRLEDQTEDTALEEVTKRFNSPDSDPAYTWGITETVASSVKTYGHQDQALAKSGAQVEDYLFNFERSDQLCIDAFGMKFECAGIIIGTEERLRAIPVENLNSSQVRVDMTGMETFTSRGLRYQMYQHTGIKWEAVSLARTMEIMEVRYGEQWEASLAGYLSEYPYLVEEDLRFVTYLVYQAWTAGRQNLIEIGDFQIVPQSPEDESIAVESLGIMAKTLSSTTFDSFMHISNLGNEMNKLREQELKRSKWLDQEIDIKEALNDLYAENLDWNQKIDMTNNRIRSQSTLAITSRVIDRAAIATSIAAVVCATGQPCNEDVLKGFVGATSFASMALEAYDIVSEIKELKKMGIKGPWSSLSRSAKAAAIVGLVVEIGLIWTQFALTMGDKLSGFQFDSALGTAIVATIFAIVTFVLLMIPGVNIVAGVLLLLVGVVDLFLWLFGSDISIMGAVMSVFFRAKMVTKIEEGSARYLGSGSGLLYEDLGVIPGNTFIITDTFTAVIVGSKQLKKSNAWSEWSGVSVTGVITATNMNGTPTPVYKDSKHKEVKNDVGVSFMLGQPQPNLPLTIDTNLHFKLRYRRCILWVCKYKTDHKDDPDTTDLKLDVLPGSIDDLWNWDEINNPDRDGDGLANDVDPFPDAWDGDDDGLGDQFEVDNFAELGTDPAKADSDQDDLDDGQEISLGTSPGNPDSDGDGLSDGEEIAGWEVRISVSPYRIYSDPLVKNADGDGLTDKMERDNHTSPYAPNSAPSLLVDGRPFSAAPYGKLGTYVAPGTLVTIDLTLLNTTDQAVDTTLQVSMTNSYFSNIEVTAIGVTSGTVPPTEPFDCGDSTTCYRWDFGARMGEETNTSTLYILPVDQVFTATLTTVVTGTSGTGSMTYTMPYQDMTISGVLDVVVVVDGDNPTATLTAPADGNILSGKYYVTGGSAVDDTTWVKDIDLLIDQDPGEGFDFGQPIPVDHYFGSWASAWTLPTDDGHYTLAARARDLFGNESELTQVDVVVDNTPPQVVFAPELAQAAIRPQSVMTDVMTVTVTGEAFDNLTGVDRVQVRLDGGPWQEAILTAAPDHETGSYPQNPEWSYDWPISAKAQGSHSLAARGLDRAGNMSGEAQIQFVVDMMPPSDDLLTQLGDETPVVKGDPSVTLTGYANDAGNAPLVPRPVTLQDEIDAIADATVWLSPQSIFEDDGGVSLAWAGDLDSDRRADMVLGFPASASGDGKIVVHYGRNGDWKQPPDAESLAEQWTSFVGAPGAGLGSHLAAVGDVNGDGLDDLLVGDPEYQRAFLVYGRPSPMGREQKLDGNDPRPVPYTLFNRSKDQLLADFVAPAGDLNGDGYADLLIGAAGTVYLILGHRDMPLQAKLDPDEAAAAVITLPDKCRATGLGDVNGDKLDDWVVTDPGSSRLYLLSGSKSPSVNMGREIDPESTPLLLTTLDSDGVEPSGVAALGDVNGDGLADFIYGSGEAPRLVLGRDSGSWGISHEFSGYTPPPDGFLAAPGDVDGDGLDDLLLGTSDQRAYLILGRTAWTEGVDVKATIKGVAEAASSPFMASADLNCDRSADLLLLPSEAGVSHLLAADRPFDNLLSIEQDTLSVTVTEPEEQTTIIAAAASQVTMTSGETLYVDDDYCSTCANGGLTWQVDAFDSIQEGLDAVGDRVISLGKAVKGPVTVSVGPGVYAERLTLPSHVRLIGINTDEVKVDGGDAGDVITVEGVAEVEIRGLHITHSGEQTNTGVRVAGARHISITHNLIVGHGQGIVFEEGATGKVIFNTIVDNSGSGLSVAGSGSWAQARNNILAGNGADLVTESGGMIFSNYNLLPDINNYEGVLSGDGDIQGDPLFEEGTSTPYHLQTGSPAVDAADPEENAPVGGGSRAEIGYYELRAVPLTLLLGKQGSSCAEGNSGISRLEVALVPVTDISLPITHTLPADGEWQQADLETLGQVASYWSTAVETQQDGLNRIYTRATDILGNQEDYSEDWYGGAMLVDSTPPIVSWNNPVEDLVVSDIALLLQATAADWLDTETGQRFSVADVGFEVNGERYPANWAEDGWDSQVGQPRTFEALVPLWDGANEITAVATDLAGHESSSYTIEVTSTITGNEAAITSILDGSSTNQSELDVSGYARFTSCSGMQRSVQVQVDGEGAARVNLDADFSAWSASVDLGLEGQHTLTAYATCNENADLPDIVTFGQVDIWLDQTAPVLVISSPAGGALVKKTVWLEGTIADTGSGIGSLEVSVDGGYTWDPAVRNGDSWSFNWKSPSAEPGVTYRAQIRAVDKVGNATTLTHSYIVDAEPPGGIEPLKFSIAPNTHLEGITNELQVSWEPAIDTIGPVTVMANIDQITNTVPVQVVDGLTYSADLDMGGEWYFHLKAQDAAGNSFLYHEGPWYVSTFETGKSIAIDGYLDLPNREWNDKTELLDDDERALAGIAPVQFKAERQFLYATWDSEAVYLGWRGAWWDMHGTMWTFVDAKAGGNRLPPLPGLPELPFEADYAIQVSSATIGTLWEFSDDEWQPAPQGLNFAQGGGGDTEVKLPLDVSQIQDLSLVAMAMDDAGTVWSAFPTTNQLDQWVEAYHWGDLRTNLPNTHQPVGTTAVLALSSSQPPQGFWSPGSVISHTIEVKNWERRQVAGLQISFEPGEGLTVETSLLDLPGLASEASHTAMVDGQMAPDLGSLTEVVNTITLQSEGTVLDQAAISQPVDGQSPAVQINLPPDNVIGTGLQFVSGTADDGDGSGVVSVQVGNNTARQTASGTSFWTAEVTVPEGDDYTLNIIATDATGNTREVSHTYFLDTNAPELSFSMPPLLTGDDFALFGTTSDGEGRVIKVEVQLDGGGLWLPAVLPLQADDAGGQPWLFLWELPQDDHVEHQLRARAVDVAGNENVTEWQTTVVDTVAPIIAVDTTLTKVLLSDHDAGNPNRDPKPIVSGTVSDNGGLGTVLARIKMPNDMDVTVPAVLEGTAFSITPIFDNPVSGEYVYNIEATDAAGNLTVVGPFTFTVLKTAPVVISQPTTQRVSVFHGIDGRRLGLSKEFPVNVWIMKGGVLFAKLNDITYQERIEAKLPAGEYTILIESVELGAVIESMTTGPINFSEGDDLRIRANLGVRKIPILTVRSR
jgi:hypothetical protein